MADPHPYYCHSVCLTLEGARSVETHALAWHCRRACQPSDCRLILSSPLNIGPSSGACLSQYQLPYQ